jgi:Zn-dependent peptidase ImmA (M78 family)
MATKDAVEAQANTAATPLTTPCTVLQLRQWLKDVDSIRPGTNTAQVTASASSISVA